MPAIKITDFKGRRPRTSEKLLPQNFAQTAQDCHLLRGKISAVGKDLVQSQTGVLVASPVKIYKFENDWLSWPTDVDVVRSPLGSHTPRIYYSNGTEYPKQTSERMATMKGAYFSIEAPDGVGAITKFYLLVTVDGSGSTTLPDSSRTVLTANISGATGYAAANIATRIASVLNAHACFGPAGAVAAGATITITNANPGVCVNAIAEDCGFTINTTILGTALVKQETTVTIKSSASPAVPSAIGYPLSSWRLGVPAPETALTPTIVGDGDGKPVRSTNWVYTYVTAWGEESKPSPPTDTYDIEGISQQTAISCGAPTELAGGAYFLFSGSASDYYCWYTIDGSGADPTVAARTGVEVTLLKTDNPDQIAAKIAEEINGLVDAVATSDGPVVTISPSAVGNVSDIGAGTSPFAVTKVQDGSGSAKEISTVDCSLLTHGSYFSLFTEEDKYYVWYQVSALPEIVILSPTAPDTFNTTLAPGDYFILYVMYPDTSTYQGPPIQKKVVVWFDAQYPSWVKNTLYSVGDFVTWNTDDGVVHVFEKIDDATIDVPPSNYPTAWEIDPNRPSVDADVIINVLYPDPGTITNVGVMTAIHDYFEKYLSDVLNISLDTSTPSVTVRGRYDGVVDDPADGTAATGVNFSSTYGKNVSDDPGVPNAVGLQVDIDIDYTATEVAEKTADAINKVDAFSCEKSIDENITVVNSIGGAVTDAEDGNTGFSISTSIEGSVQMATFTVPSIASGNTDVNVSHIRLYRVVTSANGNAEFQLVPPYAPYNEESGYAVGDYVVYNGYAYYCHMIAAVGVLPTDTTYFTKLDTSDIPIDTALLNGIGDNHIDDSTLWEVLATEEWDMAPDDLHGLTMFDNGIIAGFSKNKVYFSEPLYPYVYPDIYALQFPDTIVGLGFMPGAIIVLTEGIPHTIIGNDPRSLNQMPLPYPQPCSSKRGIMTTERGVVYPSPDGLFEISQSGGILITKQLFTKDQWPTFAISTIIGKYFDGKCFVAFSGFPLTSFADFGEEIFIVEATHETAVGADNLVRDITTDGDYLYFLFESDTTPAVFDIYKYDGSGVNKTFVWKSKKFQWPYLTNFSCGRVIADWSTSPTVTVKLYVDGTLKQTVSATNSDVFRLTSGFMGRIFEIQIEGEVDIDFVGIASNPTELFL